MSWDRPDDEDLRWLLNNARSARPVEGERDVRGYWLRLVAEDYGVPVPPTLRERFHQEDVAAKAIDIARERWKKERSTTSDLLDEFVAQIFTKEEG